MEGDMYREDLAITLFGLDPYIVMWAAIIIFVLGVGLIFGIFVSQCNRERENKSINELPTSGFNVAQ